MGKFVNKSVFYKPIHEEVLSSTGLCAGHGYSYLMERSIDRQCMAMLT